MPLDPAAKKMLIERITNTRYTGGATAGAGQPIDIQPREHVWKDRQGIIKARDRHQDWLFDDIPPGFQVDPVAAAGSNEGVPPGPPHAGASQGNGAGQITPAQQAQITRIIADADALGLFYDRSSGPKPQPDVVYEDVYHVLRKKIEVETLAELREFALRLQQDANLIQLVPQLVAADWFLHEVDKHWARTQTDHEWW